MHGVGFAIREDLMWYLCDEEVETCGLLERPIKLSYMPITHDQALHLFLPQNINAEHFAHLVIEFVCTSASGHHAQVAWTRTIELELLALEFLEEVDA